MRIRLIFALAFGLGIVNVFDVPARQSVFVEMAGKQDLMNAIALTSSMFNASRMIGPAVGGILVAQIGEGWRFLANGMSCIAVIAGPIMMKIGPRRGGWPSRFYGSCGLRRPFWCSPASP